MDGMTSPRPLGNTLPAVYLQDHFAQQICAALDEVLAPVFATLDSFPSYLDPATAPEDMLDWLAGWIGLVFTGHESVGRKRELIASGAQLLPWRGTARGVREGVQAVFNGVAEIVESGGATSSTEPNSPPPGSPTPGLTVRLTVSDPDSIDRALLDAVIAAVKPAHIPHRAEVVSGRPLVGTEA